MAQLDPGSIPRLGRSPREGNGWLPTPMFLPREFHRQRSLPGYSPWGCKELDTTEQLSLSQDSLSSLTLSTIPEFNLLRCCCHLVIQPCSTLCDPKDCSLPGFSVQGISQARILETIAIAFCRGSFQSRERICISCVGRQIHYC